MKLHDFGRALARGALGLHGPARVRRRPRRALDAMVEADLLVDAVVARGLAHVVQNPRPVGDRLRLGPRPERIAERIHVAVGANARIAEQVPRAADAVAALQDHVALAGAILLQVIARADAGQAGADDQDVEMFVLHGGLRKSDCPTAVAASQSAGGEKEAIRNLASSGGWQFAGPLAGIFRAEINQQSE